MKTADEVKDISNSRLGKIKEKIGKVPKHIWFLSALLIITLIALAILYPALLSELAKRALEPFSQAQKENVATPAEPRIVPLATGKQIYNISGGTKGGPQMTQAVIDPLDPKSSQIQTFALKANNLKPIVEIKATVVTDNGEKVNYLKLVSGTNVDGVWQGSWRITDDYDYNYQIILTAKNNEETESKITLTFR